MGDPDLGLRSRRRGWGYVGTRGLSRQVLSLSRVSAVHISPALGRWLEGQSVTSQAIRPTGCSSNCSSAA